MKVMLVDDHNMFRNGLEWILLKSDQLQFEVTISSDNGKRALQLAKADQPDVAIIDINMPEMDGIECTSQLHSFFPDLPILMLSMYDEPHYALYALESGARGYLTKRAVATDLIMAIKTVYCGKRYLPDDIKDAIAMIAADGRNARNLIKSLSRREFQVMIQLSKGVTNREIAKAYNISIKTVDTYRIRILQKMEVRNNVELTRSAAKHGLVFFD